jgi:hypothetical protein
MPGSGYPARDAAAYFTDLRVITAMLCITWPASRDFTGTAAQALISQHAGEPGAGTRPPRHPLAAAGLLTAAASVIENPDQQAALVQILRESGDGKPSRTPWAVVLDRHGPSCSQQLREALEPAARAYRKVSGPHSPRAPARRGGHGPEVIPALLEQRWYDQHLARLGCPMPLNMRRAGSVVLVQWAVGGSMGDAASYLGIRVAPSSGQHSFAPDLALWLAEHGEEGFTSALHDLAAHLDADAPRLVNYYRRRRPCRNGAWPRRHGKRSRTVCRRPPGRSSRSWTTGKDRKPPRSPGHTSPRANPLRTPADRSKPARAGPQGLGTPPGKLVAQARLPRPVRPPHRTPQAAHRARRPSREGHRLQQVNPAVDRRHRQNVARDHGGNQRDKVATIAIRHTTIATWPGSDRSGEPARPPIVPGHSQWPSFGSTTGWREGHLPGVMRPDS